MSTLDEIAGRDAEWPEGGYRAMEADEDGLMFAVNDRRYLLGLVREARDRLDPLIRARHEAAHNGDIYSAGRYENKADLGPAHFMATVWGAPSAWAFSVVFGRRYFGVHHHSRSLLVHRA